MAYLNSKFGHGKVPAPLRVFEKWGTGTLVASTAIPFPFPTSMFFAAAGASNYRLSRFITIVAIGRGIRYSAIAIVADVYGRSFTRILRHPTQHWGWLLVFTATVLALVAAGILANRRLEASPATAESRRI